MQRAKVAMEQPAIVIQRQPIAHRLDDALDRRSLCARYPGALDEVGEPCRHRVAERLLPIEPPGAAEAGAEGPAVDYIYEPDPVTILAALLPRHVEVQLYRALLESAAGEHGARMTAMEAASKNAQEMIGLLTIQYNKARQERITKELLDIVGGAEALRASAGG